MNDPASYNKLLKDFKDPSSHFGEIGVWWWEAGKITKEKLAQQIDGMRDKGISGICMFNLYFPGDRYCSDPEYFSEGWWKLVEFSVERIKKNNMEFWFSDWSGLGYWKNVLIAESEKNPELKGKKLKLHKAVSKKPGETLKLEIPEGEEIIDIASYRMSGESLEYGTRIELDKDIKGNAVKWQAEEGGWILTAITSEACGLDYVDGRMADRWIELYWEQYKKRLGKYFGTTIKGYISDELFVMAGNLLFSKEIFNICLDKKKYDISKYLAGLFFDIGDMTDRVRCSYYEILSSMLEDNFYGKISNWHRDNNIIYGTEATLGRGDMISQITNYGDFMKMMRQFDSPGNEDPRTTSGGHRRLIDSKISSSIQNTYKKDQTLVLCNWLSGWGQNYNEMISWFNEVFSYGINRNGREGIMYTLMGGWYEFVPPDHYFYQPHWEHWKIFGDYTRRMSYVMSQGSYVRKIAILYPTTSVHANWTEGNLFNTDADFTARKTFMIARLLFKNGLDFDFVDDDLIGSSTIKDGKINIEDLGYSVLIIPPITTIKTETMQKIKKFYENGGIVLGYNKLPRASAENGRNDKNIKEMIREIFGVESSESYKSACNDFYEPNIEYSVGKNTNDNGGKSFFVPGAELLIPRIIGAAMENDITYTLSKDIYHKEQVEPMTGVLMSEEIPGLEIFNCHKKIGDLDVYFILNYGSSPIRVDVRFKTRGMPEVWDCFTGKTKVLERFCILEDATKAKLEMESGQAMIIVFKPYDGRAQLIDDNIRIIDEVKVVDKGIRVTGFVKDSGRSKAVVNLDNVKYVSETRIAETTAPIVINGKWDLEVKPTMDNKWGDFRYPGSDEKLGPEVRRVRYRKENGSVEKSGWHRGDYDDSTWSEYIYSYGPYYLMIGPFGEGKEPEGLMDDIRKGNVYEGRSYGDKGPEARWQHYDFSLDYGVYDTIVQHAWTKMIMLGINGVSDNFIKIPENPGHDCRIYYLYSNLVMDAEKEMAFDLGGDNPPSGELWVNGSLLLKTGKDSPESKKNIILKKGANSILLKLIQSEAGTMMTYLDIHDPAKGSPEDKPFIPRLRWFRENMDYHYDISPENENQYGWYRFEVPAGLKSFDLDMVAEKVQCWVDGVEVKIDNGKVILESPTEDISKVAIRVEHRKGRYGGAAFNVPVRLRLENARIPLGNWEDYGFDTYSGGLLYRKSINLGREHLDKKAFLNLGDVGIIAELMVNGKKAGVRICKPYRFDITDYLKAGENKIEVIVYNTLANHYSTYKTYSIYSNQSVSGLLGPVTIEFYELAEHIAEPVGEFKPGELAKQDKPINLMDFV